MQSILWAKLLEPLLTLKASTTEYIFTQPIANADYISSNSDQLSLLSRYAMAYICTALHKSLSLLNFCFSFMRFKMLFVLWSSPLSRRASLCSWCCLGTLCLLGHFHSGNRFSLNLLKRRQVIIAKIWIIKPKLCLV